MRTFYFCVTYSKPVTAVVGIATVFATLPGGVTRQVLTEVRQSVEAVEGVQPNTAVVTFFAEIEG